MSTAALLRASLNTILDAHPEITPHFYARLWARHPELRPMFSRSSPEHQARMLQDAIVAAVDHAEDAVWLQSALGAMGRRHLDYGVTAPMYDQVGAVLLDTLAALAGPAWTPEVAAAWADTYGALAGIMITAAEEASMTPS
jgi:hemoglobin-like flavoprotein